MMLSGAAAFIFAILTDTGPVPVFWVDTHEQCVTLMKHSLQDAMCEEIE